MRPVVDGIVGLCIKFAYEKINDGEQIGDEHGPSGHYAAAESAYGKEEIYAGYGADEAVDADALDGVNQSAVFPQAQSGNEGKEKFHRYGSQEAYYYRYDEENAGDCSYYKVFHTFVS